MPLAITDFDPETEALAARIRAENEAAYRASRPGQVMLRRIAQAEENLRRLRAWRSAPGGPDYRPTTLQDLLGGFGGLVPRPTGNLVPYIESNPALRNQMWDMIRQRRLAAQQAAEAARPQELAAAQERSAAALAGLRARSPAFGTGPTTPVDWERNTDSRQNYAQQLAQRMVAVRDRAAMRRMGRDIRLGHPVMLPGNPILNALNYSGDSDTALALMKMQQDAALAKQDYASRERIAGIGAGPQWASAMATMFGAQEQAAARKEAAEEGGFARAGALWTMLIGPNSPLSPEQKEEAARVLGDILWKHIGGQRPGGTAAPLGAAPAPARSGQPAGAAPPPPPALNLFAPNPLAGISEDLRDSDLVDAILAKNPQIADQPEQLAELQKVLPGRKVPFGRVEAANLLRSQDPLRWRLGPFWPGYADKPEIRALYPGNQLYSFLLGALQANPISRLGGWPEEPWETRQRYARLKFLEKYLGLPVTERPANGL